MKPTALSLPVALLAACLIAAGETPVPVTPPSAQSPPPLPPRAEAPETALQHFQGYLAGGSKNEIRCVWFSNHRINVGMCMTLDLSAYTVYTVRDVYDWASQNQETRKLSHPQVLSLTSVVATLPPSAPDVDFAKGLHVSIWEKDKVVTRVYPLNKIPAEIRRIYDIGGDYLPAADPEPKK